MLDDIKTYSRYDKSEISFGIEHLPEQIMQAWNATRTLAVVPSGEVNHVVVLGMGGSALGPHILASVFVDTSRIPITVVSDYALPAFVSKQTLVVLSSFSGSTEEVLYAAKEAKKRRAQIIVMSAGGKLGSMAKREGWPCYTIVPGELAKQPRLGIGFSLAGLLGILERYGVLQVQQKDIHRMMKAMADVVGTCSLDVSEAENPAKIVAQECVNRPLLLVGAQHLGGSVHAMQNQINESGKQVATYDLISELNHHRLEGLTKPEGFFAKYAVIMVRSQLYHPRIQRRFDITADVFEQLGARVIDYNCGGGSKLEEAVEVLQFGSFVSYYLGMLNKVDPEKIPYVDWFKEQLAKK